jgi:hypothetical protein
MELEAENAYSRINALVLRNPCTVISGWLRQLDSLP